MLEGVHVDEFEVAEGEFSIVDSCPFWGGVGLMMGARGG